MDNFEKKSEGIVNRRDFLKLGILATATSLSSSCSLKAKENNVTKVEAPIAEYKAKNYSALLGNLNGITEEQLNAHFKLYENYINKINSIENKLRSLNTKNDADSYRSLMVEQSFMLNGAVLHELYFGNLGVTEKNPSGNLKKIIDRDFGNTTNFIEHMKLAGTKSRGWALAAINLRNGRLNVYGLDSHNELMPALVYPILALDVYEHAYMIDYGIDRAKYLDAFVSNINWEPVENRLNTALSIPFGDLITQ